MLVHKVIVSRCQSRSDPFTPDDHRDEQETDGERKAADDNEHVAHSHGGHPGDKGEGDGDTERVAEEGHSHESFGDELQ